MASAGGGNRAALPSSNKAGNPYPMSAKMKVAKLGLIAALVFTLFCCCSQKAEWQGTIEVVDGVIVVKNPKEPLYIGDVLELEGDLSIGEKEGKVMGKIINL